MESRVLKIVLCVLVALTFMRLGYRASADTAEPCDSETCMVCHEDMGKEITASIHWGVTSPDGQVISCQSCHGPSADHCNDPEAALPAVTFKDTESADTKLNMCFACHGEREHTSEFKRSAHIKGGITCDKCHHPHDAGTRDKLLPKEISSICLGCHEEKLGMINLNERHRIKEGMVTCVDCHDQHGPSDRNQLGGFKQNVCYKCHTDKQGPFLYEHLSVRIERCTTCHDPHGSVNRHMLLYENVADLCLSCHVVVPSFHSRFTHETQCTNCHANIHGSNLHPYFLD
jgi:DmsE family decaheme c-type cytochrome